MDAREYNYDKTPEDQARRGFLVELDNAAEIEVDDWEATFIGDHLDHPREFTAGQRQEIDRMMAKYLRRL